MKGPCSILLEPKTSASRLENPFLEAREPHLHYLALSREPNVLSAPSSAAAEIALESAWISFPLMNDSFEPGNEMSNDDCYSAIE